MKVSIIIPCYNQAHFLAEAIESALNQDVSDKEVIVVNDGSPDNSREVASAFGDAIVYIEQSNRGASGARNAGIRAARGYYIAFLDSDDVYLPGALSAQGGFLDSHEEFAMVCGDAILSSGCNTIGLKSALSGRPKHPGNFRWETVAYCATTSTVMLRRSCFDTVGLFDEALRNAAEDWQMWVRISLHFNMAYLDIPFIRYRMHEGNVSLNTNHINAGNRYAVTSVVNAPYFNLYPAHFRARLLFYRFATAWRVEPRGMALRYFMHALSTDPTQLPYGLRVVVQGLKNTLRRWRG